MNSGTHAPVLRMDWLDYLRFVCAMTVMAGHFTVVGLDPRVSNGVTGYGLITEIVRFGIIALFLFFMMSGLVITLIAQTQSAATFVTHRAARIYPTFVLCVTVTTLFSPFGPERFHVSVAQYLANLTLQPLAFGYRFVDASYWTLPVEITFYTAMAVAIVVGAAKHLQWVVAAWIILQLLCAPFVRDAPLLGINFYFLAAGAVMALLYQRRNEWLNYGLLAISLVLCTRCVFVVARSFQFDPWIGSFVVVLAFGLFLFMRDNHTSLPWARRIASLTYPLYLLHFHIGLTFLSWWVSETNKWLVLPGVMLFLIVCSALIDDLIEFRLRPVWARFFRATIARPVAWSEEWMATRMASRTRGPSL